MSNWQNDPEKKEMARDLRYLTYATLGLTIFFFFTSDYGTSLVTGLLCYGCLSILHTWFGIDDKK